MKISGHPLLVPTWKVSAASWSNDSTGWQRGAVREKMGRVWELVRHLFAEDGLGYAFHKHRELSEELGSCSRA